jgi:hypothetical protein
MRSTKIPVYQEKQVSSIALVVVYFVISVAITVYLRANTAAVDGFFAELGNVSEALASGKGFSNVFLSDSGPTAWCPPFNVICYAVCFKIFGIRTEAAFWALVMIRCLLFAVALYYLFEINYSKRINKYKIFLLPIFLLYTSLVIFRTGPKDAMFNVFFSVALLYVVHGVLESDLNSKKYSILALAVLLPLTNITLTLALLIFIVVYAVWSYYSKSQVPYIYMTSITILVMSVVCTGWGVRNKLTLGQFVPFKSNLWFEMYISNVVDQDGVLKYSNYEKYHPYSNPNVAKAYREAGEIEFLQAYKELSIEYLKKIPTDFFLKVFNRSFNILIFAETEKDIEPAAVEFFKESDIRLLEKHGLLIDDYWVCLEYSTDEFDTALAGLALSNAGPVKKDWQRKVTISQQRVNNTRNYKEFLKGIITSLLPTISIIMGLTLSKLRRNKVFILTILLYAISIGPYLIISWTPRYQSFQIGLFTIFLFMLTAVGLDSLTSRLKMNPSSR